MQDFHVAQLSLPPQGTHLVEASAGTGKTYNIAALFTRLVVLEGWAPENILVVTFTDAATAELKNRLRAQLGEALAALQSGETPADEFLQHLLAEALAKQERSKLILQLQAALSGFDTAAIYTIHGFCLRVLGDYAFLCGVPFELETGPADSAARLVAAQDFWREHVADHPQNARIAARFGITPASVLAEFSGSLKRAFLDYRLPENRLPQIQKGYNAAWQKLRQKFDEIEAMYCRILPQINKTTFNKTVGNLLKELKQLAAAEALPELQKPKEKSKNLLKFETEALRSSLNKAGHLSDADIATLQPLAVFGRYLAEISDAEQEAAIRLKLECLGYLKTRLADDKRRSPRRDYDDLLLDVHAALSNPDHPEQAEALAQALAAKWRVALIDEFQDTDPLQYAIFHTAFIRQGVPVFLVGDPKQAIYGFRGADIHAYLAAAAETAPEQSYTLRTNYRSHRDLVNGIGHLFAARSRPFVLPQIAYPDVQAARAESLLSPAPEAAVAVRWINPAGESEGKLPNKDALRELCADYCAREIAARLNQALSGSLSIGGRHGGGNVPLHPGQVAVLVRTHSEAALVARALKRRGVRSVLLQQQSVFDTPEAEALHALLLFWLAPQQTEYLRFVLGGIFYGYTAQDLAELNGNENRLAEWIALAETAAEAWQQHGIYTALTRFARQSGLEQHLLHTRNEHSFTNFWQLAEILALATAECASPVALAQWLEMRLKSSKKNKKSKENKNDREDKGNKEYQLRLESDEDLVKIVTMHAAKGLEYPLVFCPFVWDASRDLVKDWNIISQSNGRNLLLAKAQLGEEDERQLFAEDLGERLRLLYVALTRAREQLVIYAAPCSNTPENTFAYLLAETGEDDCHAIRSHWSSFEGQGRAEALRQAWLKRIQSAAPGQLQWLEDEPPEARYHARDEQQGSYRALVLPERPLQFIRHTSFTGLSRQTLAAEEWLPESLLADENPAAETERLPESANNELRSNGQNAVQPNGQGDLWPNEAETALLAFPAGTTPGICLHSILEKTDFVCPTAEQAASYADILVKHGFEAEPWLPAVLEMVEAVRRAPLVENMQLADIPADSCVAEMGFVLHLHDFGLKRLRRWFARPDIGLPENAAAHLLQLDFHTVNGFLNGFIDLIAADENGRVCVIDHKSNHLGNHLADYGQAAMSAAVSEHHYYLQALIYAVATARYLKQRHALPEYIYVRYLFVRGLNPHGQEGLWCWDIPVSTLQEWLE
ncbi:exodeoxyribonuclease V subunit beta [Eikenella sp. NML99-0057]|uniref:exodeoxyribonuclease V subunit beta n=1 Tax=Eikenella sp. NML99-0057 TaxID=1795834 RepID=UPI0007E20F9F|nr:exodeoxyribonuclease V subunit beta [Eikenella sp. NML99-0057]OAM45829.1 exodeoxyribonuclease V subunit beta [Eikenella sp. NML99-0057]